MKAGQPLRGQMQRYRVKDGEDAWKQHMNLHLDSTNQLSI